MQELSSPDLSGPASLRQGARGKCRVSVDIGGTFTDIVMIGGDGSLLVRKVSSTPRHPAKAVIEGLARLLESTGISATDVVEVLHGTTVGSNCILEKKGAVTGLLTTRGFRDVLEIGRIRTPDMFNLSWSKPLPLAARRLRLEAEERIDAHGEVVRPLDEATVIAAARTFREAGVESVAVCFINSHRNPTHEQRAEALLNELCPGMSVTASYKVLPEMKEYERTSTTVVNAYIQPSIQRYLRELEQGLAAIGIRAPLLIGMSNGGVAGATAVAERPVFAVGSGPAAGVIGAARLGRALSTTDLVVFDKGGTTAKASIVEGGNLTLTSEYEFREGISTPSRFIKAGGYMLKVPAVDIAEVGAGGGSIAWIDAGGLLKVGPESAGADPGPACYGLGGNRPTVTDANVVLGILNPAGLAAGSLKLDKGKAEQAILHHVAEPLGLSVTEAAWGIRSIVNANMVRAIRSVTVERGRDPRRFTLVAFGGGGPSHAVDLAKALEMRRVLVPMLSGVFTAVGMLSADVEHHFVRSFVARLGTLDFAAVNTALDEMAQEGRARLADDGYHDDAVQTRFLLDLRLLGQGSELTLPLGATEIDAGAVASLVDAFRAEYQRTYGHVENDPIELVNIRLVASGTRNDRLDFTNVGEILIDGTLSRGSRLVHLDRLSAPCAVDVVDRTEIRGTTRSGPLIVESYDSTILVPEGCLAHCDAVGNVLIEIQQGSRS
jgi:N-methylhydantoinase A